MAVALRIKDETTSGEVRNDFILEFPAEDITVRELIAQRVRYEVENYNSSRGDRFSGLVQPSESEQALNGKGFMLRKRRALDLDRQVDTALEAFGTARLLLLVNDRQAEELDDLIRITPNTEVIFLKLVPLVGG